MSPELLKIYVYELSIRLNSLSDGYRTLRRRTLRRWTLYGGGLLYGGGRYGGALQKRVDATAEPPEYSYSHYDGVGRYGGDTAKSM